MNNQSIPASYRKLHAVVNLFTLGSNTLGALLTFWFLVYVVPVPEGQAALGVATWSDWIFTIIVIVVLLVLGSIMGRAADKHLPEWYDRMHTPGGGLEAPEFVRRQVLNYPPMVALTSLAMWLLAGFFLGFLTSGIWSFIGISFIGGVLTSALAYFSVDVIWRQVLPLYFPDGKISRVRAIRLSVFWRLLIVLLLTNLYPVALLVILSLTRADALMHAPNPEAILQNLLIAELFILGLGLIATIGMAFFVYRTLISPIESLQKAMSAVERNDLNVRVPVLNNDEIGYLSERFNDMVTGLKRAEMLRNLLNIYVSPEVARAAIEQGTSLGGQVVECSVLFSDIRGFTTLSEQMLPDKLIEMLNQYMFTMVDVIIRHGGIVNKFGGDSLLAVFGTPLNPSADHSAQAVRAALGMHAALVEFNKAEVASAAPILEIGIGIASGKVVAGNIGGQGRIEYTVIGDTVNLASRLQSMTKELHSDILLNDLAYQSARGKIAFNAEALPPMEVRGKAELVQVYSVS